MPKDAPEPIHLPDHVWRDPAVLALCRNQDANGLFRLVKRHGVSNERLGYWTGTDAAEASKRINNKLGRVTGLQRWHRIADGLNMPDHVRHAIGITGKTDAPMPVSRIGRDPLVLGEASSGPPIIPAISRRLPALRSALDVYDSPDDGPIRSVDDLKRTVADVVRLRLDSQYERLAEILPQLLADLGRASHHYAGQRRSIVAGLLAQTYRAADAIADKFGYFDLSARIVGLMTWAAEQSGDHLMIAAASYVRAEAFFASCDFEAGRRMLDRAAERLMPGASVSADAAYGALHMRAAVLAGKAGRSLAAIDHLDEARSVAQRVSDGIYTGTVFGPTSVRIHDLSWHVENGDPQGALKVAESWTPPATLPAERRSHFFVDLARTRAQLKHWDDTRDALMTARRIAPESLHSHPDVKVLMQEAGKRPELRDFSEWMKTTP